MLARTSRWGNSAPSWGTYPMWRCWGAVPTPGSDEWRAVEADVTCIAVEESGHDAQQGRLAAAGWSERRHDVAACDIEVETVEHQHVTEALAQATDLQAAHATTAVGRRLSNSVAGSEISTISTAYGAASA